MRIVLLIFICLTIATSPVLAQKSKDKLTKETEEIKLPDPLRMLNGKKVRKAKKWEKARRSELLMLFENNVYGRIPGKLNYSSFSIIEESTEALDGNAVRKQVQLIFQKDGLELPVNILMYLPKNAGKVPVFLGYNFYGNHTISYDSYIELTEAWVKDNPSIGIINNQITEQSRGARDDRWPIKKILERGYGLATVYYGEVDPDKDDFNDGVHPFFYKNFQNRPKTGEWGAISAWAWGLTKVMDYFVEDEDIDENKVVVMGHSRLGKTALWAGAIDKRFAMVISNNSGCGGAALSKRKMGETVKKINTSFPHWFSSNFKYYSYNEEELPIDQHELIALIAPRPVYIASAAEDLWADPEGEFLAAYHASKVYELYDKKGLSCTELPEVNSPIMNDIGYHIRTGRHGVKEYDWEQFLNFADKHLKQVTLPSE